MKRRGHSNGKSSILENFEEEVVNVSKWNTNWPICLYDFLYRDRKNSHFALRSQQIQVVDDYFGDETGEHTLAKTNSEVSFQPYNLSFEDLLIERNVHICQLWNLEEKFKVLFGQEINEFFLSVIHLISDDPFDELTDNSEKIQGFIEIWIDLISRHNLSPIESKQTNQNSKSRNNIHDLLGDEMKKTQSMNVIKKKNVSSKNFLQSLKLRSAKTI
jgi:hypothetical protein